ncbi:MAG: N-acetyltransferase, partial [Chloroflexota bacterium]|nr:N-acetyltransferase [Chloroflexota bacterium]
MGASGGAIELIDAFTLVSREQGIRLVVASEQAERRKREFYVNARFDLIEQIIIYELSRIRAR